MSTQVRLLPAVIGAAGVLVALRLGAMAFGDAGAFSGTAQAVAEEKTQPAAEAPAPTETHAPADAAAPTPAPAVSPADPAQPEAKSETNAAPAVAEQAPQVPPGQNKGEVDILRGLRERRTELDDRERDLGLREQLLAATEQQVDQKIAELKQIQARLDAMLTARDAAQEAQLVALVKMYESMKPDEAAGIFNKLDRRVLIDVAAKMKPVKIAPVIAAMETARAQELTVLLATRLQLPAPSAPPAPSGGSAVASQAADPMPGSTGVPVPVEAPPNAAEPTG